MFYITASSAAAAADIMLDPTRLLWIRQISTWWFVFDVLACLTSCTLRPLTNLESFGLIFYVYNWFGRTLLICFVAHQTIKVPTITDTLHHHSAANHCRPIYALSKFRLILMLPLPFSSCATTCWRWARRARPLRLVFQTFFCSSLQATRASSCSTLNPCSDATGS